MDRDIARTESTNRKPARLFMLAACLATAALTAGCRAINRRVTEGVLHGTDTRKWHIHHGSTHRYELDDDSIENVQFVGAFDANRVRVKYQRGLHEQARTIADRTAALLEEVEQRIGLRITTESTLLLIRLDEAPRNFSIRLTVEPNEFPLPLFVSAGDESYHSILAHNRSYPYLFVHELVETSLVCGTSGGQVLPDLGWGALGFTARLNNYTRWFRDGLANYAGFVACRIIADDLAQARSHRHEYPLLHNRPFSALSTIGPKLFSWPQSSRSGHEKEYYNAALGLFLLLDDRFGEQAIRDIMREVSTRRAVDRRDLLRITNQVIGTDIRKLAANFDFPETGLKLQRMTPALALNAGISTENGLFIVSVDPNSAADQAGLRSKDVILTAGETRLGNHFDFEMALFQTETRKSIPLEVHREEEPPLTLDLPLNSFP